MAKKNLPYDASPVSNGIPVASAERTSSGGGGSTSGLAIGGADVHSEMFRSLADQSLEFIGMCDLAFKPFYVNPAGMQLVGLDSLEAACAVKVQDFFFPEDQRYITEDFFPKVLREGRGQVEIRFRHFRSGAALWMIYNAFQVTDAHGRVSGYATVSRNITDRKGAEEAVRESEEKYRLLFDTMTEGFGLHEIILDADGKPCDWRFLDLNAAWEHQTGMVRAEVVGKTMRQVWPDLDACWLEKFGKVALSGESVRSEGYNPHLQGWYEVLAYQTKPNQFAVVFTDITERKHAEEALRESEAKYHSLFNSIDDGFCIIEVLFGADGKANDYRFVEVNAAFERHTGLQGAVGKRVREMVPNQDAHWFEKYGTVALTGEPTRFAIRGEALNRFFDLYAFRLGKPEERRVAVLFRDETERRQAEERLREERDFSAAVLETAGALVVVLDTSGRIRRFNRACAVLTGYTEEEVLGQPVWVLIPPEDVAGVRQEWSMLSSGIRKSGHENHWLAKDGTRRLIAWSNTVLVGANGEIQHVVGTGLDITEQRRSQQALRKSEERQGYLLKLGDALRPLRDPVEVQEAAARVLAEHLRAERVLYFEVRGPDYVVERDYAKSVPQLRGRFPISAFGPRLWESYQSGRTVVVKDVETDASLTPEERPAYAAIQIRAHVGVPLVKGGQLVAGLAVHSKERREWTTEEVELIAETAERTWAAVGRARAEEALRKSEESYRTLFTSIDEGFCVLQVLFDEQAKPNDWRFLEVNPAFARQGGQGEATGKRVREVLPGIEEKWLEIYGKVALTGEPIRFVEHSAPVNRWFDLYAFRVGEPQEHKVAVLFTDITARKQAEAELAQYREELEELVAERTARLQELVAELEHFSYTITHDLKAPLRAMRGFAEIAGQVCGEGEAKPFLEKISTAAERMDRLIADALSYSRSVRQELPLEDVDAGALLRGILDSYPQFQPWKAQIRVEGRLPVVLGNEAGLTQCFSNLLGNAVKFVKPGEKPEIRVLATQRGEWVRIWVEDKGIGISKEMLPRVFEMFSRGSKDHEGTGIGLALVRKVVQRMGGRVGVESEEGKGSRFWIELGRGEMRAISAPGRATQAGTTGKGTVLYVEDEESDALFMERAFAERDLGGKLRLVGTGRAAIDYLSGSGEFADREKYPVPSVVLLDLNLPQVSGFGVLEWIRNHPDYTRLPVVVFSSSTREDDRTRALELGADEFVSKPNSGLKFGEVVEGLKERWLGRGRPRA